MMGKRPQISAMARHLFLAACLLVPVLSTAAERASARKAALLPYQLRIEAGGWGGASLADLEAVYRSACSEIAVHLAEAQHPAPEPIRIRHDPSGPIVLFRRSLRGERIVQLNAKGNHWSQHAYQFAHEFCHILCRFKDGERGNLWFEESLCEMASIYALRQMAMTWKTAPPYPNWRDYSDSLRSYADDVAAKYSLPDGESFGQWFRDSQDRLRTKPTQRELNGVVAMRLLPVFEKNPEAWQTLRYLNIGRGSEEQSFGDYLEAWRENTPNGLQPLVASIIREFGPEQDRQSP